MIPKTLEIYILKRIKEGDTWLTHIVSSSKYDKPKTQQALAEMVTSRKLQIVDRAIITDHLDRPLKTEEGKFFEDFKFQITEL